MRRARRTPLGRARRLLRIALTLAALGVALLGVLRLWVERKYRDRIYASVEAAPRRPVAIAFGAGLWPDGSVTPVLADRVATAVDLYRSGVVDRLLFSGDNRVEHYNEPQRMLEYAARLGAPPEIVVLDYAGRRTWDTVYRAREIFGVEQAVVVTQRFHIARALYLCDELGIDAVGVVADRQDYTRRRIIWEAREYLALAQAWWDVNVRRPVPVLGDPLPIDVPS